MCQSFTTNDFFQKVRFRRGEAMEPAKHLDGSSRKQLRIDDEKRCRGVSREIVSASHP